MMTLESVDLRLSPAALEHGCSPETFDAAMSPMMALARAPRAQQDAVAAAHASPLPTLVWWGPEHEQFANAPALDLLGPEHAPCMGRRAQECWTAAWDLLGPLLAHWAARGHDDRWQGVNIPLDSHAQRGSRRASMELRPIRAEGRVRGFSVTLAASTPTTAPQPHSVSAARPVLVVDQDDDSLGTLVEATSAVRLPLLALASEGTLERLASAFSLVVIGPGSAVEAKERVARIRRIDSAVCLPILVVGTASQTQGTYEALLAGADEYLSWPVDPVLLSSRIESMLATRLRNESALIQATQRAWHLERALDSNRSIGMALGILMVSRKITSQEAFESLKQVSQRSNRKLRDIADEVIYTGTLPEQR